MLVGSTSHTKHTIGWMIQRILPSLCENHVGLQDPNLSLWLGGRIHARFLCLYRHWEWVFTLTRRLRRHCLLCSNERLLCWLRRWGSLPCILLSVSHGMGDERWMEFMALYSNSYALLKIYDSDSIHQYYDSDFIQLLVDCKYDSRIEQNPNSPPQIFWILWLRLNAMTKTSPTINIV